MSASMFCRTLMAFAALASGVAMAEDLEGILDPKVIVPEQGFCYAANIRAASPADGMAGQASYLRLFENSTELGPAHALHQSIRTEGEGFFSHWGGDRKTESGDAATLYFSTSDNSDPRTNGRTYQWAVALDRDGKPAPAPDGVRNVEPCQLNFVPTHALARDRHTMLLAGFDAASSNDADFARAERREVGMGGNPGAPGKFGGGVSVEGASGAVMYAGLDNYNPLEGTVEFWAQSRAKQPIWTDGKEHWLLVLYPERAGASSRYGMAPYFIALRKTPENEIELRVVNQSIAPYAAAVSLRESKGWSMRVPAEKLAPEAWHHLLLSWSLRDKGRMWLSVNGEGVSAPIGLRRTALRPNPGMFVVLGGIWGLPGDNVATSECNLDDLRVQDCAVAIRRVGDQVAVKGIDEARLLQEEDLARAMLDKLMELQFHGGWSAGYNWPTYGPTGWSLVGRGVDMWFAHSALAGQALLRGWLIWGDDRYLDAAIEAADMFCKTQMANGSWAYHYTYSRGQFEPWGESAYLAQAMQSNQIRFLCLMYKLLGYERYGRAIRKSGDWMASIQFPSGAWGWECYPLGHTGPYGHPALNDAVTPQAMSDLFVIWCATGERKYLDPVLKGAKWILDCQAGSPTFGWADQYDEKNRWIWMRNFEPPAVSMQAVSSATWGLCQAYDLTGDDKYLAPLRKVLRWMDTVPQDQRGWLWYDPEKNVPVVAYDNEMLPVTHPKAIREIIPRLDAHYGAKFPWQADRIRSELKMRVNGPAYPDSRGWRSRKDFAQAPDLANFTAAFRADQAKAAREQLAAWRTGKPLPGVLGGAPEYGRTFQIGSAINYCEALLSDIEMGRVALGDMAAERVPRYARSGSNNWVYMAPQRDFFRTSPAKDANEPGKEKP